MRHLRLKWIAAFISISAFAVVAHAPLASADDGMVSGCSGDMPPDICEMVDSWILAKEQCGNASSNSEQSCEDELQISKRLNAAGYSYGCAGEFSSQRFWRNDCSANAKIGQSAEPDYGEDQPGYADARGKIDFSCSGTADSATNMLANSPVYFFAGMQFHKIGVAPLQNLQNQLVCKLVVKATSTRAQPPFRETMASFIYTATILDDGTIWIEFSANSNSSN